MQRVNPFWAALWTFVVVGIGSSWGHAASYKCDNGIIQSGDSKFVVDQSCGAPTYKDFTKVSRLNKTSDTVEQTFVDVEDWLYNFGPSRLVIVVTFKNGKLRGIRSFDYGRSYSDTPEFNKKVTLGAPTVRVLYLYGEPSYKEERVETKHVNHKDGLPVTKSALIATWTYNFGPNRLMKIYHFKNGHLVRIETGKRGF